MTSPEIQDSCLAAIKHDHLLVRDHRHPPFFLKKIKQLKYTYTLQEASTCRTRGESEESQARKYASKGIHPGFKTQGRRHQKSKTGVSVIPQKGLMSSIKLKKYVHITFG